MDNDANLGALAECMCCCSLREAVRCGAIRSAAETARIVPGVLGERAEVLGALALVLRDSDRFVSSRLRHSAAEPR